MTETSDADDVAIYEETSNSLFADDRNYYRIEKWTKDGSKFDCLLCERLAAPREIVDVLFKEPLILEQSVARCVHEMPEKRTCVRSADH
jgi:hypothetical protein